MKNIEEKIFAYLAENLSPKRFEHSFNVAKVAVELAGMHGADVLKAQTAALLHDCAKSKTPEELKILFKGRPKIEYFDEILENSPDLLHSYASAAVAEETFGIKDKDVLNAISSHTFGRPAMSALEKIIFIADFVSKDRKHAHSKTAGKTAKKNLEEALLIVLEKKIEYVLRSRLWICRKTLDTWNYYAPGNKNKN